MIFLGRGNDPRVRKAAESLRRQQLDEGGWSIYPGGPAEPSASVKAYFVLKYLGYKVQLYDASFTDWSAREDTAVETGRGQ